MLKQYADAVAPLRECIARAPNFRPAHVWLGGYVCSLGQMREAREDVAEVLRIEPTYTINGTSRRLMDFKNAKDAGTPLRRVSQGWIAGNMSNHLLIGTQHPRVRRPCS